MIGKIRKGKSFLGLARYLFGPGKNEEHQNARTLTGCGVFIDSPNKYKGWVEDMRFCAEQNPRVKQPVWHCSLRLAPEDAHLSDQKWASIAQQHISNMGLTEHPWVAVRHGDDHIHIVASRVNVDGKLWRDSHDYARSMTSCRRLEQQWELTVVTQDRATKPTAKVTAGERAKAARRHQEPERLRLRNELEAARQAAAGKGIDAWHQALTERGIMWRITTTKDGRIRGYSVSLPDWTGKKLSSKHRGTSDTTQQIWVPASKAERQSSWRHLSTELGVDKDLRYEPANHLSAAKSTMNATYPSGPPTTMTKKSPTDTDKQAARNGRTRRNRTKQKHSEKRPGRLQ